MSLHLEMLTFGRDQYFLFHVYYCILYIVYFRIRPNQSPPAGCIQSAGAGD